MRVALLQMSSSDNPAENLRTACEMMREAAGSGATFLLTPEVTNCVSLDRAHQAKVLKSQGDDETLAGLRAEAKRLNVWLLIGSLALRAEPPEQRFVNRSFLIDPSGGIVAWYDKLHMFDVQVSEAETYRESTGYAPGDRAVLASSAFGNVGMTICYDLRFPGLYRHLAQAGAEILTIPAAFSPATGPVHWETLLRARAIETGCFVLAPAQVGQHHAAEGKRRTTYGHSMVVSPWGEVVMDAGTDIGVHITEIELAEVAEARRKIPSLQHDREYSRP